MLNPPMRPPRAKVAGMFHLARMLDKARLDDTGKLPEEYRANLGHPYGLDGQLCEFLGIDYAALRARLREGGTDEELAEWCFSQGLRPSRGQKHIWNEYARKLGWNDRVSAFVQKIQVEDGVPPMERVATTFDAIDRREGRRSEGTGAA